MATETKAIGAPPIPVVDTERIGAERPANRRATLRSFGVTFFAVVVLAAFLSPMLRTLTTAFKSTDQITETNSPLWPADPGTFTLEGEEYDVYVVGVSSSGETFPAAHAIPQTDTTDPTVTVSALAATSVSAGMSRARLSSAASRCRFSML